MNIEQEIKKIKYHQKLMLTMFLHDDSERFAFYHQIIDFDLDEQIEKTILNIISLFNKRLSQDSNFSFEKDYFNSINFKAIYDCNVKPTIEEYESYLKEIDLPINPKYLLMAINKQKELDNACQFLLEQYSEK
ncbi:DUF1878 family protein [Bacillus pseudomycoides]|uniref:DUF1878 family protein n=1 Tax=Bacillus pseudomycoides TaxID=64104 RepID=UPI0039F1547C